MSSSTVHDPLFLKTFFRALAEQPLEPTDPLYVHLYDDPDLSPSDPVDRLAHLSGGHIRDLLRLLRTVLLETNSLPVSERKLDVAIQNVRNEFLPLTNNDVRTLRRISQTHNAWLEGEDEIPDLARFFDTHMVLVYRNGEEWYDVHPIIVDEVNRQFKFLQQIANEV